MSLFSLFKKVKKLKQPPMKHGQQNEESSKAILGSLQDQLNYIKEKTGNSTDVIIRKLQLGDGKGPKAAVVFVEGIADSKAINEFLIESIMKNSSIHNIQPIFEILSNEVVALGDVNEITDWDMLFLSLMSGESIILVDGAKKALSASTRGGEHRSIQEPGSQVTVRGPRDGFTESIRTNTSLIRRRIQNPNLWMENMKIGTVTKTDVSIMYIKGIAKDEIVEEVRNRLKRIEIDGILESGYIEQLIEDQASTTFPTLYHTERPDMVAGNLLEGRVAIIVNGTPFVLIAPAVFIQFFQSVEDYYGRADIATALRFLRILIFFISIIAPAAYIAVTTFHQEMIPTQLLVAIAAQREAVPFPAFVEALIMEVAFEGVSHLAITNHDTTEGLEKAVETGKRYGIEVIPGIEMSGFDFERGRRVHILGYFIEPGHKGIETICQPLVNQRHRASEEMVERLIAAGYRITWERCKEIAHGGTGVYKQHIMHALIEAGYTDSIYGPLYKELFNRGQNGEKPGIAFIPMEYIDARTAVQVILLAGGVPVLAHPGQYRNFEMVPDLVEAGLQGIEVWHPLHHEKHEEQAKQLARKYDLIMTGGSDFHGEYGEQPVLIGSRSPGIATLEALIARRERTRKNEFI